MANRTWSLRFDPSFQAEFVHYQMNLRFLCEGVAALACFFLNSRS